jgi:hypothetical protein
MTADQFNNNSSVSGRGRPMSEVIQYASAVGGGRTGNVTDYYYSQFPVSYVDGGSITGSGSICSGSSAGPSSILTAAAAAYYGSTPYSGAHYTGNYVIPTAGNGSHVSHSSTCVPGLFGSSTSGGIEAVSESSDYHLSADFGNEMLPSVATAVAGIGQTMSSYIESIAATTAVGGNSLGLVPPAGLRDIQSPQQQLSNKWFW